MLLSPQNVHHEARAANAISSESSGDKEAAVRLSNHLEQLMGLALTTYIVACYTDAS